jgi:D-methionine transport system ATP-binding protein
MIHIAELSKSYNGMVVLDKINLHINKGEIYGLVGASGVGKSTLLRCINGLESYDEGALLVDGVDVKNYVQEGRVRELRKKTGMIFQQFSLLSRMDVYDNIAFPMRSWKYDKKAIDKKVHHLLELVDLRDKIHARPRELSGGQKQRVAIARALSMDPRILLCDEPTSALDPKIALSITDLLCRINQDTGITIVLVTHQMPILRSICKRITILENSKVAVSGDVEDIFLKQHPALMNLTGNKDAIIGESGITLKVILPKELSQTPAITRMVNETGLDFVILGGETERFYNCTLGAIIINLKNEDFPIAVAYFERNNIRWYKINKELDTDRS